MRMVIPSMFLLLIAALWLLRRKNPGAPRITMAEVSAILQQEPDFLVLDVRTPREYLGGHIPGAINIPNEMIGIGEIPQLPDKNKLILLHCHSGSRSAQAAGKLARLGYRNVLDFGALIHWPGILVKGHHKEKKEE